MHLKLVFLPASPPKFCEKFESPLFATSLSKQRNDITTKIGFVTNAKLTHKNLLEGARVGRGT